jgi:NAD(P)-dependent dehydrogenase (short-subunit alcohol dehydrogenase family)
MFSKELQRRLEKSGSKVLSVAAHPGMSDTNLFKHVPKFVTTIFGRLIRSLMVQTPENGAKPTLYAALGNDIQGGDYIGPDGWQEWKGEPVKVKATKLSDDKEVAKRLWVESEKLTGCKFL